MRLALVVLAGVLCACASTAGTGRARVLDPGEQRVGLTAELSLTSPRLSPAQTARLPWFQIGAGYQQGVLPWLEVGGRAWGFALAGFRTGGAGVHGKLQLRRGERLDVAIVPGAAYHQVNVGDAPTHAAVFRLPLLLGVNHGGGVQSIYGVRAEYQIWMGVSQRTQHVPFAGLSFAVAIPVGAWDIVPEAALTFTPLSFNGLESGAGQRGMPLLLLAIGGTLPL